MNKWIVLITFTLLYMGFETARGDGGVVCSEGHSSFGRLSCSESPQAESLMDTYFLGASSLDEVMKNFPERFERIHQKCIRKMMARENLKEMPQIHFQVQPVYVCVRKRGYQEPCVKNSDCIENFCHPDRGTCSAVFTIPMGTAQ